jgi:beta-N-acetylhexosaminidase
VRLALCTALAGACALASGASAARAPRPAIVWKPIPFPAKRVLETRAYERRHYGLDRATLVGPHVIVEHVTANESFAATWNTFAADRGDPELNELPGDCAQFAIDEDGTIYQLVRLPRVCRHTVGLNWTAIGIEHVGTTAAEVLHDPRQLRASLRLTLWLAARYGIGLRDVIGHAESLTSRYHRERDPDWRCQTHADWAAAEMRVYRARLRALARAEHVPLAPGTPPKRTTGC